MPALVISSGVHMSEEGDEKVPWIWIILAIIFSFAVLAGIILVILQQPAILLLIIGMAMIAYGTFIIIGAVRDLRSM